MINVKRATSFPAGEMASGTLYTYPKNFRAYKTLVAAQYSGANVSISEDFKFGETNKNEKFLSKFPLGKVPAFESSAGVCLFESNAIAYYVSNDQLRGACTLDSALIQQWIHFSENEIVPAACSWVFPCLGITQFNKQEADKAKAQLKTALGVLNQHLLTHTFIVGERVTLADIVIMCNLLLPYEHVFDAEFREPYGNVHRWFTTMIHQPNVQAVISDFTLCSKAAKFDPAKYAEIHGIQKKEKKAPAPKKEATPKKKEDNEDEQEEESATMKEAKVAKDPFADMPTGTFTMDEFKRSYCNNDVETVGLPYLWEHFDSENYSIWLSEYKYPKELTKVFMTCNLVSGMFQRLDKLNKNAFASVLIFGKDGDNSIGGVWIWKGTELAFTLSPNWEVDYASYTWTKLDTSDQKNRELVNAYLRWDDEIDGKKLNEGKLFK